MDYFKTLQELLGCPYISDMTFEPWREIALEKIKEMNLNPIQELKLINYIKGGESQRINENFIILEMGNPSAQKQSITMRGMNFLRRISKWKPNILKI